MKTSTGKLNSLALVKVCFASLALSLSSCTALGSAGQAAVDVQAIVDDATAGVITADEAQVMIADRVSQAKGEIQASVKDAGDLFDVVKKNPLEAGLSILTMLAGGGFATAKAVNSARDKSRLAQGLQPHVGVAPPAKTS